MYSVVYINAHTGKRIRTTYHDSGVPVKSVEVSSNTPLTTAEEKDKRWFSSKRAKKPVRKKIARKARLSKSVGIRNMKELTIALRMKKHGKPAIKKFSLK